MWYGKSTRIGYFKIVSPVVFISLLLFSTFTSGCGEKTSNESSNDESSKPASQKSSSEKSKSSKLTADRSLPRSDEQKDGRGNTTGNIANTALAVQKGEWIYYCNPNDVTLNRMKIDGSKQTKISEGVFFELNIVDDWIYCSDQELYKLYKMKLNGFGRTKLTDDQCYDVNVVDKWIYYISDDGRIYKIDLNGRNRVKLNDVESCRLNVVDDWIYFCKMNKQANIQIGDADWLPCGKIFKMKTDGTGEVMLCDNDASFVNVEGGWVYYSNVDDSLCMYKMKTDGSGKVRLNNDGSYNLNVTGNYIYYSNMNSLGSLYRMNKDGSNKEPIGDFDGKCWEINITDKYLFFNFLPNGPGDGGFFRTELDGKDKTKV